MSGRAAGCQRTAPEMRKLSISLAFIVFAADLLTKWWVKTSLWLQDYPIVEEFVTIQYVENTGIAFGLFDDSQSQWKSPLLSLLAVVAMCMVLYYIWTTPVDEHVIFVALGLVLGGILGNFVDRLTHQYVVDFIKLHWRDVFAWPTFNLADSAITTGVLLILALSLFGSHSQEVTEGSPVNE